MEIPTKRILLIGMLDSIHVARWVGMFRNSGYSFILFPSSPNRNIHPLLVEYTKFTINSQQFVTILNASKFSTVPFWILDKFLKNNIRVFFLKRIVLKFNPDFIHALELQNAGYLVSSLQKKLDLGKKIIVSNYGSDIFWFRKFKNHRNKLRFLLSISSGYIYECVRDLSLAQSLGFCGEFKLLVPNSAGLNKDKFFDPKSSPNNERFMILIKGYQGKFGQSIFALLALIRIKNSLTNYRIVFYSTNMLMQLVIKLCNFFFRMSIESIGKHKLTHDRLLELFRISRIYIGLSKSDGISTSCIEAMAQGCIPIQSDSSCANEWFTDGSSGFLVKYSDFRTIADKVKFLINDNNFIFEAQQINCEVVKNKYDLDDISKKSIDFYDSFLSF
jgi:hypothetical protein